MSTGNSSRQIQAGAVVINIIGNNNNLNTALSQATQSLQNFQNAALRMPGFRGLLAYFRDSVVTLAGLRAGLHGITAPLRGVFTAFSGYDYTMSRVQAITQATAEQMTQLREQAKLLGRTTFFTTSQVAEDQKFLGMAGFNPNQIEAALPNVLNLALAGDMQIGEAADIATNISTPFKIAAEDLSRINDILAKAANSSNTNVHEMGEAFKYVAPVAAATDQSIEELGAAMAILANNGLKADMAGTSLRMMLMKLSDSGIQNNLLNMGIDVKDAKGNLRPILDIINDIKNATAPTDRAATFIDIFEARAGASALALAGSTNAIDNFRDAMENATGTADEMARTMADNLRGDWIAFRSAVEGVQIAIGEAINGTTRGFLQRLTALTRGLVDIITVNRDILTAPFRMLRDIIGQTVQALTNFINAGFNTLAWARNIGDGIRDAFGGAIEGVVELFNQNRIGEAVRLMWLQIQLEFEQGRLNIINRMNETVAALAEPFTAISAIFANIWQWIGDTVAQVAAYISETWGNELNWLSSFFGQWWGYILDGFDAWQNDIGAVIVGGWWFIATGINNAITGIETFWNNLVTGIMEAALFAVRAIVRQFAWAYAKIRRLDTEQIMNEWTAGLENKIIDIEGRAQNRANEIEAGRQQWQQSIDDSAARSMDRVDQVRANAPQTNDRIEQLRLDIEALRNPATDDAASDTKKREKNKEIENLAAEIGNKATSKAGAGEKNGLSGTFSAFEMGNVTGNVIEDTLNKQLKSQQETNRLLKLLYQEGGLEYA
jgi:TP901 family phage tail tape measure protein